MARQWRWMGWVAGSVLLLMVAIWAALPPLVKWQGETRLSAALGRPVTIGKVEFEPWRLALTVHELAIGAAPPGPDAAIAPAASASTPLPLLQVARLHVDADIATLWRRAPVIEAIEIDSPRLHLARTGQGHYDIDDLIARLSAPTTQDPSEPARFALYNLQLRGGELVFDDRPVGKLHRIEALELALPFVSNLPAHLEVTVEPRLSFRLDGSSFDSGAQARPFAATRRADLQLRLAPLDLRPYRGYLPASLPVALERAVLAAELSIAFAQPPSAAGAVAPQVTIKGWASVRDFAITDRSREPRASWSELRVELRELQPLARQAGIAALRLDDAKLWARRERDGRIDLARLAARTVAAAADDEASPAPAAASAASAAPAPATPGAAAPWRIALDELQVRRAWVHVIDEVASPAAEWLFDELDFSAGKLAWPDPTPVPLRVSTTLHRGGADSPVVGKLTVAGQASDHEAKLELGLDALQLDAIGPYLARTLSLKVSGTLWLQAALDWSIAANAPRLAIELPQASIERLRLTETRDGRALVALDLQQLALAGVRVDLIDRQASLASVKLREPKLNLARDRAGQWSPQRWPAAPASAPTPTDPPLQAQPAASPEPPAAAPDWKLQIGELLVDRGALRFEDAAARKDAQQGEAAQIDLGAVKLRALGLAWPAAPGAPIQLQLAAQLGAPATAGARAAPGTVEWNGRIGLAPAQAAGSLRIEQLPVHRFEAWFADRIPVELRSALATLDGRLAITLEPDGPTGEASADLRLSGVSVFARPSGDQAGEELLNWNTLTVEGAGVSLANAVPPKVSVRSTELRDFYSRLVVTEQGRFNLRDVRPPPASSAASAPAASAPATSAPAGLAPAAAAQAAAPAASAAAGGPGADITIGPIRLVNGRVDFTDRFIRPNYSARLTELNGQLGAFASGSREMATLELRGRAEGTALLEITGQLNPTADPPALDIRAKATDLELAPLSPYAGKYAGYAIERGKLSMEVAYRVDPDGKLEAKNRIVLNQLTFGERVESPSATQLPVLLAVALLKDRHGVIDIDLPVSGSLQDPQFSVGGIVVKLIVNLLTKALTAPFALLAGSGSEDLSSVGFEPGTTAMTAAGRAVLDKVAQALADRPALTMTVTGMADPAVERAALQRAGLDARLDAQRRREAERASGKPAESPGPLAQGERERLLGEVYRQTGLPDKPRNAVGLVREIPAAQMEAMLLAMQPAGAEQMRELALQRGVVVRDALAGRGLASARLFLAAPKLRDAADPSSQEGPAQARLALSLP